MLATILLGFFLRIISLNQSFWIDEATSATAATQLSYLEIITKFMPGDFHPPLYYLLLKFWLDVVGPGEVPARLLSVLFGIGTIVLIYKIGEKLVNKNVGMIAALLLVVAPLHIYYSQEARMYSMLTFLVTLSVFFFIYGKFMRWGWSLALLFLTDYMGLLALPMFWVMIEMGRLKKSSKRRVLFAHLPLLISMVVWSPILLQQLQNGLSVRGSLWGNVLGRATPKEVLLIPAKFIIGRITIAPQIIYVCILAACGIGLAILFFHALKIGRKINILWAWMLIPLILAIIISFFIPVLSYFRLLFILPAFLLLVACGINSFKRPLILSSICVGVSLAFSLIYLLNSQFHREDWRGLVEYISEESVNHSSLTLFVANSQMEAYKYYAAGHNIGWGVDGIKPWYDQIWLLRYVWDIFDSTDSVRKNVEELGYNKQQEYNFNGIVVYKYTK